MVDQPTPNPPINIHIHGALGGKDRARLYAILKKEITVTAPAKPAPATPGWQTTEFWITVLASVGAVAASAQGSLPPRYAALASTLSVIAYAVSRGLAKH